MARDAHLFVVTGMTGIGKSIVTKGEIIRYVMNDPKTTRCARPVIVVDITGEYKQYAYKTLDYDHENPDDVKRGHNIINITKPAIYRMIPFKKNGQPMSIPEVIKMVETICKFFVNGMLLLDDINKYDIKNSSTDFIGALISVRHLGVDLQLNLQSMAKVSTSVWENIHFLRFHKQADDIDRYKGRIPNVEIYQIAEKIINKNYREGQMVLLDNNIKIPYFITIDARRPKMLGVSESDFKYGCKEYLFENGNKFSKLIKRYGTEDKALNEFIKEKIYYMK